MSDLSDGGGGLAENWGYPSPLYNHATGTYDSKGMVWHGDENATKEDVRALYASLSHLQEPEDIMIDWPTCFGYPSFYERNQDQYPYKQTVVLG
jgi:hypothetical protein